MKPNIYIPEENTADARKARKKIIKDFYAQWISSNPTKHIYNIALKSFIEIKYLSIHETSAQASYSYKSTLAVFYLTEILEKAKKVSIVKPKANNKNQKRFSEIIIMEYSKKDFGKIKLTIGVLKGSKQNVQYCITSIEKEND
jgi:hypothetical protein